ncbi:cadherin domain protein, partial [Opisthorchis viverrini]
MVRVFVTVLDIDDNRCRFLPSDHQHIYVSENQNATQVSLNTLADLDTDSQNNVIKSSLRFITPQSDLVRLLDRFDLLITDTQSAISPYKLDLLILKPLDYEDQNLFELTVKAGGRKQKHSCSLLITVHVLDENDHPPRFSQRLVHLPIQENVSTSQPLFTPVASDNDDGPMYGKLLFEMSPFNSASVRASFYVVPDNGSVFLRKTLNYAERSSYKITLVVRNPERTLSVGLTDYNMDGSTSVAKYLGEQDTMDLIIDVQDVNDNCPKILMYSINGSKTLTLTEHMSVPQADFAVVRVTDEDSGPNGQVTCTLDENSTKTFKLTRIDQVQFSQPSISSKITENYTKSNGAMFKLAALRSFDRETSDQVSFGILCIDHGEPPQRTSTEGVINILDVNDHVPKFETTYVRLEIVEDTDPNRQVKNYFVLQLNASDKDVGENGKISYSLSSEPEEDGLFTIDQDSGIIRTTGKLDRELNSTITLIAMATDSGEPKRSASLKIHLTVLDYNDQTPQFEHSVYEYSVKENVVRGHLIGSVVACDKDYGLNAVLNFYLTYSLHGDEDEQKYRFESEIPFRIMPSYLVTTHCYEAKLFTNSVIDREQLLTESKETGIEKNTQMKNRTSVQVFDLEIVAEDSGTPKRRSKAKINLLVTDENDEHPVFLLPKPDQTAIELSQYEPVHSEFLQVLAVDRDEGPNGTVQYFIRNIVIYDFGQTDVDSYRCNAGWIKYKPITTRMGINLREYFYMNSSTGKLRLARELPSKLVGHVCIITILARDMGPFATLETSLNICVKITDSPSRQINGSIPGYLRRAPQQRTLFYLYIITGVLVSVLTFSITFVLAAYCLWYRGDVSSDKHISNAIHYSEGGLGPEETHRDANDFIYRE